MRYPTKVTAGGERGVECSLTRARVPLRNSSSYPGTQGKKAHVFG